MLVTPVLGTENRARSRSLPVEVAVRGGVRKRSLTTMLTGSLAPQPSMRRAVLQSGSCRDVAIELIRVEVNSVVMVNSASISGSSSGDSTPLAQMPVDPEPDLSHLYETLTDSIVRKLTKDCVCQ